LNHWKNTKGRNLETPDCVTIATQNYRNSTNKLLIFLESHLEKCDDYTLPLDDLKSKYFEYISKNMIFKVTVMTSVRFIEELRKLGYQIDQLGLVGYKFKED
jgi:hypothetical protein